MAERTFSTKDYQEAKAALKDSWGKIALLRGEKYTEAVRHYRAEKARLRELYAALQEGSAQDAAPGQTGGGGQAVVARPAQGREGIALRLTQAFMAGDLDLSARALAPAPGWSGMPELIVAQRMRDRGVSDAEVRLLLTLTAAMDRARDADRLWFAAERLFADAPWAFQPEQATRRGFLELADRLKANGVSQRHGPDSAAWRTILESLADGTVAPEIRRAIHDGTGQADALLREAQATTPVGLPQFPMLRGPKIGPMWVRMLAYPGAADISGIDELPVAVDVQVRKVTEYLAVTDTGGKDLEAVRRAIQTAWTENVRAGGAAGPAPLDGTCGALDPALWFWAKWGCTRCEQANRKVPIADVCGLCRFPNRSAAEGDA